MIKKLLVITLTAAFCLATICQADAFAWSPKKALKKAVSKVSSVAKTVVKPIAKFANPIKSIGGAIVRVLKETINVISLATSHTSEFRQQWRMWTGRMGIYDYSDHDFIRHASSNEKVRQALILLRDKAPDVFRWIKKNVAVIKISGSLDKTGQFKAGRGRMIFLSRDAVNNADLEAIAGFIVHETVHLTDYFKRSSDNRKGWEEEFAASKVEAGLLDQLGAGEGWKKLQFRRILKVNYTEIEATHGYSRWKAGDKSTGGYWKLENDVMLRGILKGATINSLKPDYTIYNPSVIAQATWDYSDRLVDIDYSSDKDNPTVKVIGITGPETIKTIWLERDGTLKKQEKVSGMITEKVLYTLNATINSASMSESSLRQIMISFDGIDISGNFLRANMVVTSRGILNLIQMGTTYLTGSVASETTTKEYDDDFGKLRRERTKSYGPAGNLLSEVAKAYHANGNLISDERNTYDAVTAKLIKQEYKRYDEQTSRLVRWSEQISSSNSWAEKYKEKTYDAASGNLIKEGTSERDSKGYVVLEVTKTYDKANGNLREEIERRIRSYAASYAGYPCEEAIVIKTYDTVTTKLLKQEYTTYNDIGDIIKKDTKDYDANGKAVSPLMTTSQKVAGAIHGVGKAYKSITKAVTDGYKTGQTLIKKANAEDSQDSIAPDNSQQKPYEPVIVEPAATTGPAVSQTK